MDTILILEVYHDVEECLIVYLDGDKEGLEEIISWDDLNDPIVYH
jgi:hypothetical protein